MSLVPSLLANLVREIDDYRDLDHMFDDDDFGFGIHPLELFHHRPRSSIMLHSPARRRYWPYDRSLQLFPKRSGRAARSGDAPTSLMSAVGKDGFQVCMDVSQFKPNELTVKTVDKTVVVEGKHEERQDDHGLIQRHFVRKYNLPHDYDPSDVVSTISSDGVLTLKAAPPPNKSTKKNERIVQIQQTGPAHLSVKAPEGSSGKTGENGAGDKMETSK